VYLGKVAVSPHDRPDGIAAFEDLPRSLNAHGPFPPTAGAACLTPNGLPPRPRKWARKEVAVFQMINQSAAEPQDRKMLMYKIGIFVVALGAVGGVIFLCIRSLS
jgi:hypothetical protein